MACRFGEDYFSGVGSGYKSGYTWKTVSHLLWSQFRHVAFHSQYTSGRWLDAGCAKGFLLNIASQYGWEPFGFDISSYAIKEARSVCPRAHLLVLDAQSPLPFPSDFFEVITACELIEHLTRPENFIKEAYRLLKPGGLLFITTPNASSIIIGFPLMKNVCQAIKYPPFDDESHVSYFSSKSISKLLRRCGFSKVKTKHSWNLLWRVNLHIPGPVGGHYSPLRIVKVMEDGC